MRILVSIAIVLSAFVVLLTTEPSLATTYSQHYGVVDQWGYEIPELGQGSMDIMLKNLGARWIRTVVDWDQIEALGDNQYDPGALALMDNTVAGMNALGVNIYYGFSYTPAWARPAGTSNNTPPTDPTRYTDFITFMVNRYKNSIKYWGFWNEPNLDQFFNGTDDSYIHNFLIPGIAAVKVADPTAKTVVGELASCCNESSLLQSFLTEINNHGEKSLVDVISVHGYGYGDTASGRIAHLDSLHNMIVSAGWGDKDFWCTETSWVSGSNQANQASQIIGMMQGMDARPWWKKTFYYTLGEGIWDDCGLIHPDLSPKLSYTQLQAYIADHADDAEMVTDSIPTTMVAGRQYYAGVTVRNSGTTTWNDPNQWKLGAVNDNDPFANGRQQLDPGESVAPDALKTFRFWMTAPTTTGTYTTDWQMVHEGVHWYGHPLVKQVTVNNGPDTTAPAAPVDFTATRGDHTNTLTWTNPSDADYTGIIIRYKTTGYPTSRTDGSLLIDKPGLPGLADSQSHTGLTNDVAYYYSAFAHDPVPNYAAGANSTATPTDLTPPGPVTNATASGAMQQIILSWQNPSDSDFARTMFRCKMNGYPTGPTDGDLVCDRANSPGSVDSFTHSGLMTGATYYYGSFTKDASGNCQSSPVTTRCTTDSPTLWLLDAFDAYSSGNLAGQGNWTASAADSQVQATLANTGKALLLDSVAAGGTITNSYAGFVKKTSGTQSVSFDIAQAYAGTSSTAFGSISIYADDATEIARFDCIANGWRLEYGSGSVAVLSSSVTQNTWYNIKLSFDLAQRKITAYVNGTSKASALSFKTGSGTNIASIGVTSSLVSGLTAQQMYVDNLKGETAPAAPASVTDDGAYTGSTSRLHCSWASGGPSAVEYQYAIGISPGGTTVLGWTSVGSATEVTRDGLALLDNKTYYFAVQAGNGLGSWTSSVNSNGIKTPAASVTIPAAKALPNGSAAADNRSIRGIVISGAFPGFFYIQEPSGRFGLKVLSSASVTAGSSVDLAGLMKGSGAERYLDCTGNAVTTYSGAPITPTTMDNASVGGATLNSYTPGVVGGIGPNNIGLLVTVLGKVTQRQTTDPKYFYIDDGSGVKDGTTTGGVENVGVRILSDPANYAAGSYVSVTGTVSCFSSSGLRPQVMAVSVQTLKAP